MIVVKARHRQDVRAQLRPKLWGIKFKENDLSFSSKKLSDNELTDNFVSHKCIDFKVETSNPRSCEIGRGLIRRVIFKDVLGENIHLGDQGRYRSIMLVR